MIRKLQRKYIRSAMTAVTLVMVVFLAAVNIVNGLTTEKESQQTLNMILAGSSLNMHDVREGKPTAAELPDGPQENREGLQRRGGFSRDALASEQYFCVRVSSDGEILETDLTHITEYTEEEAALLLTEAIEDSAENGKIGDFVYAVSGGTGPDGGEQLYAFLDLTVRENSVGRVRLLTILLGAVTWILVFFLVMFQSKRAIAPIAESVERQKQFVTDAGHEIKTPLAIIRANADVLELHQGSSKWLNNIRMQTDRLSLLTQNMLTLSKMEEGERGISVEKADAGKLLGETARQFEEPAAARGISLIIGEMRPIEITVRKDACVQLLSLLLDNAVKYAAPGGWIQATMIPYSGREVFGNKGICIEISNNCQKLPGCEPERLFDRFYRDDASRSSKTGGSGIGLSVAKAIAEGLGGDISARYVGRDTITFTVLLPVKCRENRG